MVGYSNLAEAARETGVRPFVLTSILTCDRTPNVPHFWSKKLAEDRLESLGVPFVALPPGAFLDRVTRLGGNPREAPGEVDREPGHGAHVRAHADLARYLAEAVDAPVVSCKGNDIGWDRPMSMREFSRIASRLSGEKITVQAVPRRLIGAIGAVIGRWAPAIPDMSSMFTWFDSGRYAADTTRQQEVFGPPPIAEEAIARFVESLESARTSAPSR